MAHTILKKKRKSREEKRSEEQTARYLLVDIRICLILSTSLNSDLNLMVHAPGYLQIPPILEGGGEQNFRTFIPSVDPATPTFKSLTTLCLLIYFSDV